MAVRGEIDLQLSVVILGGRIHNIRDRDDIGREADRLKGDLARLGLVSNDRNRDRLPVNDMPQRRRLCQANEARGHERNAHGLFQFAIHVDVECLNNRDLTLDLFGDLLLQFRGGAELADR